MPPPKYMPPSYLGGMDRHNYFDFTALDQFSPTYAPNNVESEGIKTNLGVKQLGTTLNPFQNQLQALQAKIREGASKVEFEFMGRGKGNSQQTTPETYGKEEREIMRKLAHINQIKSSTHATPAVSGLAGFGQNGFSRAQQQANVEEVQRAIDFAKDATTGGAIVVHTGEWQRAVEPKYGEREGDPTFKMYEKEDRDAPFYVVDTETGQLVQGINKERKVSVPIYQRASDFEKEKNKSIIGKPRKDVEGNMREGTIQPDDYVDIYGRYIDEDEVDQLFRRVPIYDDDKVRFKTRDIEWKDLVQMATQENEGKPESEHVTPEEVYAKLEVDNNILQSRGQSLFYLQNYDRQKEQLDTLLKAQEYYDKLDNSLSEEEKYRLMVQTNKLGGSILSNFVPSENKKVTDLIKEQIDQAELSLRHIHQASSAADAQAARFERQRGNLKSIEKYGLTRTGDALANLAIEAMQKTKQARKMREGTDERFDDLYIAPENWNPKEYGSHPEELLEIIREGRRQFKDKLRDKEQITDEARLDKLAKNHIKSTFDIGHLNMWRNMMQREKNESEEKYQKRFNDWVFKYLDKLHEEEALGHIHLTDNLGINDEHLTIGQGNAPVAEFVKWLEERGYDDFVIEPGSFNATTIMADAWSYLGATNWKSSHAGSSPRFRQIHNSAAGFYAPPMYMVGAYVPSNEFTLWSGVQLE